MIPGGAGVPGKAADFVVRHRGALLAASRLGPVLDVACGDGRNGLSLASLGASVLLVDASDDAAANIQTAGLAANARFLRLDLETGPPPAFAPESFGAVLVLRYLHRPLVPALKDCLVPGGLFLYETFLEGHQGHGKPRNPDHLLRRGELAAWFCGWETIESFEGRLDGPPRIMGRILARKPSPVASPARP
jgi:SAM-dependent methyltransferase